MRRATLKAFNNIQVFLPNCSNINNACDQFPVTLTSSVEQTGNIKYNWYVEVNGTYESIPGSSRSIQIEYEGIFRCIVEDNGSIIATDDFTIDPCLDNICTYPVLQSNNSNYMDTGVNIIKECDTNSVTMTSTKDPSTISAWQWTKYDIATEDFEAIDGALNKDYTVSESGLYMLYSYEVNTYAQDLEYFQVILEDLPTCSLDSNNYQFSELSVTELGTGYTHSWERSQDGGTTWESFTVGTNENTMITNMDKALYRLKSVNGSVILYRTFSVTPGICYDFNNAEDFTLLSRFNVNDVSSYEWYKYNESTGNYVNLSSLTNRHANINSGGWYYVKSIETETSNENKEYFYVPSC